jgi:hypothetical protein
MRRTGSDRENGATKEAGQREVILKLDDGVQLPYTDDFPAVAGRHGLDALAKTIAQFPGSRIRRLFTSVEPDRIRELMARAEAMGPWQTPNLLTYYRITCGPGVDPEAVARALSRAPGVETAYVERAVAEAGPVQPDDDPYAFLPDPSATGSTGTIPEPHQGYLDAAPFGVGARDAWNVAGGDGSAVITPASAPHPPNKGARFVTVQSGINYDHEDLAKKKASLQGPLWGQNLYDVLTNPAQAGQLSPEDVVNAQSSVNHGTAMLGIVCGDDNDVGIVGIATNSPKPKISSPFLGTTVNMSSTSIANAILGAIPEMNPGDVLHLPLAVEGLTTIVGDYKCVQALPIEVDSACFAAIAAASALGITVIEAAGNGVKVLKAIDDTPVPNAKVDLSKPGVLANIGGVDLDQYQDSDGKHVLNPTFPLEFKDSGAIVVGQAYAKLSPDGGHYRIEMQYFDVTGEEPPGGTGTGSNYGTRVDCYAWGQKVVTTTIGGKGPGTSANNHYGFIGGTSSASAIIAGVALCIQGAVITHCQHRWWPNQIRNVLKDPANGTPQGALVPGPIGSMPDLGKILPAVLAAPC